MKHEYACSLFADSGIKSNEYEKFWYKEKIQGLILAKKSIFNHSGLDDDVNVFNRLIN